MHVLVRGGWQQQARLGAGLILFLFSALHFLNTALALVSINAVETFDAWRTSVTRSIPGTIVLSAALLVHVGLALYKLAGRTGLSPTLHPSRRPAGRAGRGGRRIPRP